MDEEKLPIIPEGSTNYASLNGPAPLPESKGLLCLVCPSHSPEDEDLCELNTLFLEAVEEAGGTVRKMVSTDNQFILAITLEEEKLMAAASISHLSMPLRSDLAHVSLQLFL